MANKADSSFTAVARPMIMQLTKAQKQAKTPSGGRKYNGTSQKATHSTVTHGTKPRFNPEKNPSGGTGINTKFDDYAPRGYYPPKKGETRVLESANNRINVQPRKLKEKG